MLVGGVVRETVVMRSKTAFQTSTSEACLTARRDSARWCSYLKLPFRTRLRSSNRSEAVSPLPVFDRRSSATSWLINVVSNLEIAF